ncbi:hypothetical protein F8A87_11360 [Betaproteobacteria bacterium SCN2]|nr:hypothetical protein F8A87_11360 [Betaproteobacteria bacterium SCN2]
MSGIRKQLTPLLALALLAPSTAALGAEITVCVVDASIKDNQHYYTLPNTKTRLLCEISQMNLRPTLGDLYRNGFRIIQIEQVPARFQTGNAQPSPLIYLEKLGAPAASAEPARKK